MTLSDIYFVKAFIILILIIFNISCVQSGDRSGSIILSPSEGEPFRPSSRYQTRSSSNILCSKDSECEGICEDLFEKKNELDRCLEAPKRDVYKFEDIEKVLKAPLTEGSLSLLDLEAFRSFLKISLSFWIPITRSVSYEDAKALLGWIASSDRVSYLIYEPYYYNFESVRDFYKYEGIETLLRKIGGGGNCQSVYNSIRMTDIAGRKSFWDIAKTLGVNNIAGRVMVCAIFQRYCSETRPPSRTATDSWTIAYYDLHTECENLNERASVSNKARCREAQKRRDEAVVGSVAFAEAEEAILYYCTN